MGKNWKRERNQKIIEYLNEQIGGAINITSDLNNNYQTYEQIAIKIMEHYNSKRYKSEAEKKQLLMAKTISLESEKLNVINLDTLKNISLEFTILIAFITIISNLFKDIIITDVNRILTYLLYLVFVFIVCILFAYIVNRLDLNHNKENRLKNIAINIHKSVIEEEIKKIEKDNQIEKDIEYLDEKISEYKYKTELLEDILKVKANTNN